MSDELATRLRGSGYRLTPQRQAVLAAVEELGHATPDEIRDQVGGACNVSTVYRNLEVLEELGLVRHAHLSDRAPTYHSTREPEHFHLVCRNCRTTISVDPPEAAAFLTQLRTTHRFVADVGHLTIFGHCEQCAEESPEEHS